MKTIDGNIIKDLSVVRDFERKHGITLPSPYLEIVTKNDGATVLDCGVDIWNEDGGRWEYISLDALVPFVERPESQETVMIDMDKVMDHLPDRYIIFGMEAGGNEFAFDYGEGKSKSEPTIVLLHWGTADPGSGRIIDVAESFSEFLKNLINENETIHGNNDPGAAPKYSANGRRE